MNKVRIAGVVKESIVDGPGVRYVIFFQGCKHGCKGCHNPQTWDLNGGRLEDIDDLISDIKKNKLVRGVTFSGGEPILQGNKIYSLASKLKDLGYNIILYTGYTFEQICLEPVLKYVDYVIDGRYIESKRSLCLKYRGSTNQRVIDVAKSLETGQTIETEL